MNIPKEPYCSHLRKHRLPSVRWLRTRYSYDPYTGVVTDANGKPCGGPNSRGYWVITITTWQGQRMKVKLHRLAFALVTGRWPHMIDHEDRNPSNNKWFNLREVNSSQNQKNRRKKVSFS
jgi:hypothetical protein